MMRSLSLAALTLCLTCLTGPVHATDAVALDSVAGNADYIQGLSSRGVPLAIDNYGGISVANPGMAATAGWQPMESLRLELEYSYRGRNDMALAPSGGEAVAAGSISLMANALFDVKVTDWMTPYVGVGVGMTRMEADRLGFGLGTGDVRGESFGYQGIVGVNVPFSSRLSFFADGRYTRTGDFAFSVVDDFATHSIAQSWTALAGIRFTFGR
jgi:opacity protein-like surface antigen